MTNNKERYYFIKKQANRRAKEVTQYCPTFTDYLQSKGLQPQTIKVYERQTEHYKKWLLQHRDITPENSIKKDLLDYLHEKRNLSRASRQDILGTLRHYYAFLRQREEIDNNPADLIKLRGAGAKKLPKILTLEEINELLDRYYLLKVKNAPDEYRHIYRRNHLILSLCAYQGIMRTQMKNLTLDDIDLRKATITVQAGLQTNARTLPIQAAQTGIIYDYLNNARPLFAIESDKLIYPYPQLLNLFLSIKKIYPKFTDFNQLRASIIVYWIQTEGLRKAQYKAGHRYISSTEGYLAGDLESLKDDISKYHPL